MGDPGRPLDAILHYRGKMISIQWKSVSKTWIRKLLTEPDNPVCVVCYNDEPVQILSCPLCNSPVCYNCFLKLSLTPKAVQKIFGGDFMISTKCVECRT